MPKNTIAANNGMKKMVADTSIGSTPRIHMMPPITVRTIKPSKSKIVRDVWYGTGARLRLVTALDRTGLMVAAPLSSGLESPLAMPIILRNKLAVAALVGVFLIPLSMSSLRGLTHVLVCQEPVETLFTVNLDREVPIVLSATQVDPDRTDLPCGGLDIDISAAALDERQVEMELTITNSTDQRWNGTVALSLQDETVAEVVTIPVAIGTVEAGSRNTEVVTVRVREGTHEFSGALLVGP